MPRLSVFKPTEDQPGELPQEQKADATQGTQIRARQSIQTLEKLTTFMGDTQLLRAAPLWRVLRRRAAVFAKPQGTAEDYELSKVVDKIDHFISHNWSVHRINKFLGLAFHFNFHRALLMAGFATAASAGATMVGLLPRIDAGKAEDAVQRGIFSTTLVVPTFLIVLCSGHELLRFAGRRCPKVFLDKVCIHQTDEALKAEGIKKLGAFIRASDHMLVIFTEVYLEKLWTVYEMACFLTLHPDDHLIVVPTYLPTTILSGIIFMYLAGLANILLKSIATGFDASYICYPLALFGLGLVLRHAVRTKEAIRQRTRRFRLEECRCVVEDDRQWVFGNIKVLMESTGAVASDAPVEQVHRAFEGIVRRRFSKALIGSLGNLGLSYVQVVAMTSLTLMPVCLDSFILAELRLPHEHAVPFRVSRALYDLTCVFGTFPVAVALLSRWCGCCLHLHGKHEFAFLAGGWVLSIAFTILLDVPIWYVATTPLRLSSTNRDNYLAIAGMVLIWLSSTLLAVALFGAPVRLREAEPAAAARATAKAAARTAAAV